MIQNVTKKSEYNINSVNPLFLLIAELDGFIEEKDDSKYFTDSNNEVLKNMQKFGEELKTKLKK